LRINLYAITYSQNTWYLTLLHFYLPSSDYIFDHNFYIKCDLFYSSETLDLTFFYSLYISILRLILYIAFLAKFFIDVVNKLYDSVYNSPLAKFARKIFINTIKYYDSNL